MYKLLKIYNMIIKILKKALKSLEIGGSVNYDFSNSQWQYQFNSGSSKFNLELMMVIGLVLLGIGIYQYYQAKNNNKIII